MFCMGIGAGGPWTAPDDPLDVDLSVLVSGVADNWRLVDECFTVFMLP